MERSGADLVRVFLGLVVAIYFDWSVVGINGCFLIISQNYKIITTWYSSQSPARANFQDSD